MMQDEMKALTPQPLILNLALTLAQTPTLTQAQSLTIILTLLLIMTPLSRFGGTAVTQDEMVASTPQTPILNLTLTLTPTQTLSLTLTLTLTLTPTLTPIAFPDSRVQQ